MAAQRTIPHDIAEEILVQLPTKSLIRFKSVSKQWNLLFSDPYFIKTHKDRTSSTMNLFLCGNRAEYALHLDSDFHGNKGVVQTAPQKSPLGPHDSVQMGVAHCNGFLCALLNSETVVVWNPTTSEARSFSLPAALIDKRIHTGLGFGYASTTNEYKVVVVASDNMLIAYGEFHVLSLSTGVWKTVEYFELYSIYERYPVATFLKGRLYWRIGEVFIICFDLKRDKVQKYIMCEMQGVLGVIGESLCLTSISETSSCGIWVRNRNEWQRIFSVPMENKLRNGMGLLCLMGNNKILLRKVGRPELIIYDPKDNTTKEIAIQNHDGEYRSITLYEESLVRMSEISV